MASESCSWNWTCQTNWKSLRKIKLRQAAKVVDCSSGPKQVARGVAQDNHFLKQCWFLLSADSGGGKRPQSAKAILNVRALARVGFVF